MSNDPILQVRDLSVRFNGVAALTGVNLELRPGEICGLIGPNGAGKTTLFNCVTGLTRAHEGTVTGCGARIDVLERHQVIARGIARTFQNLGVYTEMTVADNVLLGAHHRARQYSGLRLLDPRAGLSEERTLLAECTPILERLGLRDISGERAGSLPYPLLKRVEIARALAARPRVLLLDEPAAGLTHGEVKAFGGLIRSVRDAFGLAVLLVEHHMDLVRELCSRVVVLHLGRNLVEGTPDEVRSDARVIEAYLGKATCQN